MTHGLSFHPDFDQTELENAAVLNSSQAVGGFDSIVEIPKSKWDVDACGSEKLGALHLKNTAVCSRLCTGVLRCNVQLLDSCMAQMW